MLIALSIFCFQMIEKKGRNDDKMFILSSFPSAGHSAAVIWTLQFWNIGETVHTADWSLCTHNCVTCHDDDIFQRSDRLPAPSVAVVTSS